VSSTKSSTKSGQGRRKPAPGSASATKRTPDGEASQRRRAAEQAGGTKRVSAQQRLAAERQAAAQAREAAERRRRVMTAFVPVLVVVLVVAVFVLAKVLVGSGAKSGKQGTAAATEVINNVSNVPASTFNAVGAGDIKAIPKGIKGGTLLTSDGKPRVLYVGAEYCPYCAAERWAIAVALSRFGTLHNVGQTSSAPSPEAYPDTNTLSFHGSTLDSPYIAFTPYETATNQVKNGSYTRLDSLTSADQDLYTKYDAPPYVSSDSKGSIPFVLIGGKYLISGASFDPGVLSGKSHEQIAAALKDPNSAISKAVVGTANVITAAICDTTGKKPADVCTSPGVVAGQKKLTSSS
jgi:hypothetical protein